MQRSGWWTTCWAQSATTNWSDRLSTRASRSPSPYRCRCPSSSAWWVTHPITHCIHRHKSMFKSTCCYENAGSLLWAPELWTNAVSKPMWLHVIHSSCITIIQTNSAVCNFITVSWLGLPLMKLKYYRSSQWIRTMEIWHYYRCYIINLTEQSSSQPQWLWQLRMLKALCIFWAGR